MRDFEYRAIKKAILLDNNYSTLVFRDFACSCKKKIFARRCPVSLFCSEKESMIGSAFHYHISPPFYIGYPISVVVKYHISISTQPYVNFPNYLRPLILQRTYFLTLVAVERMQVYSKLKGVPRGGTRGPIHHNFLLFHSSFAHEPPATHDLIGGEGIQEMHKTPLSDPLKMELQYDCGLHLAPLSRGR